MKSLGSQHVHFNCSDKSSLRNSYQNMTYYKLNHVDRRITSPEQRIASDVPRFCTELSDLVQDNMVAVFDGLLYTWRLCTYAHPKYALGILVNFVLYSGLFCTSLITTFRNKRVDFTAETLFN